MTLLATLKFAQKKIEKLFYGFGVQIQLFKTSFFNLNVNGYKRQY